jgi:phosphate transport system substrate-binding protein
MKRTKRIAGVVVTALVAALLASCGDRPAETAGVAEGGLVIIGAGATFPQPLYERWMTEYRKERPGLVVNYEGVGSGEGIKRFLAATVDFGASDSAMSDVEPAKVDPKRGAVMIPMTAGMVALAYNIPGVGEGLSLKRDVYQDIVAGRIRRWDDPRIVEANPGLELPALDSVTVVRRESSGTTFVMTNHLGAASPWWRDQGLGVGKLVDWPGSAMTATGNEGVAQRVKITDGSIGYMEYEFAERLGLPVAVLQNKAGEQVAPSPQSGQAALDSVSDVPPDLRVFVPDPDGPGSHPIVSYSWVLLNERYEDPAKGQALKDALDWGLTEGQPIAAEMGYIPLPTTMVAKASEVLSQVR